MHDTKSIRSEGKSIKSLFREEPVENYIVVPPDGGWGWVVVFAAFTSNVIADGITFTFGIFLEDLSKSFGVTVGRVTMVGSIMNFCYYFVGPFVSAMVNRFGFRCVAMLGSFTASAGFLVGSFCYIFPLFVIAAGVMIGLGLGMVTIPAVIVVGYYFERWRAIATGIATCGSGIGTLLTPPLVSYLLTRLDWRNTYRVLSCLVLGPGLLAILYRPLAPVKAVQDEKEVQIIQQTDSIGTFDLDNKTNCCSCNRCRRHHNRYYPTTANLVPIETVILENPDRDDDISSYSYNTYTTQTIVTNYTASVTQNNTQVVVDDSRVITSIHKNRCKICCNKCTKFFCCGTDHCQTVSRPMYRDDIFFGHSLMLLPQYKESLATQRTRKQKMRQTQTTSRGMPLPRSTGYHMSVTRVTTHRELYGNDERTCGCHLAILRPLSTMLDFRLLKSAAFQMFAWTGMFIVFGYMIPYLYIKDRAIAGGIPKEKAFWLLSAIGAANTVGRIISGILPSVTKVKVIEYSYCCILIAGLTTILSGFSTKLEFQFCYAVMYGMAGSCIATLRPIIVVELFGLENLTNAFGLQMMYMAVAVFSGTMLAGVIYDLTQDYNAAFYMAGTFLMFSAFMLSCIRRVRNYEKKHCNTDI